MDDELEQILSEIAGRLTDIERTTLAVANHLRERRVDEHDAKFAAVSAAEEAARLKATLTAHAYENGLVSGGNADTRKAQLEDYLTSDATLKQKVESAAEAERLIKVIGAYVSYEEDVFKVLIEAVRREAKG